MTRALPSRALLLDVPVERRHTPTTEATHARGYEVFRPCLRWEFFFTCPFCLLHECQVCPTGAVGSSQFSIEHLAPQAQRPELRNVYTNVVYTCRRCNLARRSRSVVDSSGRRLLDPCADVWSAHFDTDGATLVALTVDGEYTAQAYDINSPPKLALRQAREEAIDESRHVLATVPALLEEVMATIDFHPSREQRTRLEVAERLHKTVAAARRTLTQLSAIPPDAEAACACDANACDLPSAVAAALVDLELEPGRQ